MLRLIFFMTNTRVRSIDLTEETSLILSVVTVVIRLHSVISLGHWQFIMDIDRGHSLRVI